MATTAVVSATVDEKLRDEASAIYASAGLTLADAFRLLLVKTVDEHALPFTLPDPAPLNPNEETMEAMRASRRGELTRFGSLDELMADLHADD